MGQVGVKCPRGLIRHDECRRCSTDPLRPCHLSPDLLEALREDPNSRHADPDAFSPSGLLGCDRQHALSMGRDWYIDVRQGYKMLRGTLIHAAIGAYRYPGAAGIIREQVMESQIETKHGTQRMMGQPDIVVVNSVAGGVAHIHIIDYKSTGEIKHELIAARSEHVRQVNMYAWLVRRWLESHYKTKLDVVVDELEIVYLDFNKTRRFTSAGPLSDVGKRISRSPVQYETLTLAPITMFSDAAVERGIRRMIEGKLDARTELPLAYEPWEEEFWRCWSCPVKDRCQELTEQGI